MHIMFLTLIDETPPTIGDQHHHRRRRKICCKAKAWASLKILNSLGQYGLSRVKGELVVMMLLGNK